MPQSKEQEKRSIKLRAASIAVAVICALPASASAATLDNASVLNVLSGILQTFSRMLANMPQQGSPVSESVAAGGNYAAPFAAAQRINNLSNVTVSGVTGLTASDIPLLSYLPLSGGTVTGNLTVSGAFSGGTLSLSVASTSNLVATNATSSGLFATLGHFTTGIIDTLTAAAATITNLIVTTINATTATITNLAATGAVFTNATTTNATSTNLYVSGNSTLATTTIANLITTNTPVYDVRAYASLQVTIDAAYAAGGGTVQPAPNTTYTGAITLKANVTLRCVDRSTILTIANAANGSVITVSGSNTAIVNCTIDGNSSNQTANSDGIGSFANISNFLVDNVELRNTRNSGLRMSGATGAIINVTVRDSYIHDVGDHGLYFAGLANLKIQNNLVKAFATRTTFADAFFLTGGSGSSYNTNVSITGNVVQNTVSTYFGIESVAGVNPNQGVNGCTISNNTWDAGGLNASGISGYFYNCSMTGNTHVNGAGSHRSGYEIVGTGDTISGNTILNGTIAVVPPSGGIATTSHVVVSGNYIRNDTANGSSGDASGIMIGGVGSTPITDVTIAGNEIHLTNATPQSGIYLGTYGTQGQINRIKVTANKVYCSAGGGNGIRLLASAGTSDVDVEENSVTGCNAGWGDDSSNGNYADISLINNYLHGNTTAINHNFTGGSWRSWGNITVAAQTVQNLNGGATVDATGKGIFIGGLQGVGSAGAYPAGVFTGGNVGIGTTSPFAKLSIHANNGETVTTLFSIASSTISATSTLFSIDNRGRTLFSDGTANGSSMVGAVSGFPGIWLGANATTPTLTNYTFLYDAASGSLFNAPTGKSVLFRINNATKLIVDSTGNVGIATTTPWRTLSVTGTVGFDGLTANFGAGSLCLTANKEVVYNSGSDSCLSSLRATKNSITPLTIDAFSQLAALQPVSFIYNNDASSTVRYGFIAEDTAAVDPHLATYGADGSISGVDDRGLLAVLISAVQGLMSRVGNFADSFATRELTFTRATGNEIDVQKLCIGSTCVTEDQLKAMLANTGSAGASGGSTDSNGGSSASLASDASTTPDTTPPVITINGENPAHIHMGDSYADLGASVTDDTDQNLGLRYFLNDTLVSNIVIDTSAAATSTIDYVATDQADNTATSTRTVIVGAPAFAIQPPLPTDTTATTTEATSTTTQ